MGAGSFVAQGRNFIIPSISCFWLVELTFLKIARLCLVFKLFTSLPAYLIESLTSSIEAAISTNIIFILQMWGLWFRDWLAPVWKWRKDFSQIIAFWCRTMSSSRTCSSVCPIPLALPHAFSPGRNSWVGSFSLLQLLPCLLGANVWLSQMLCEFPPTLSADGVRGAILLA